MKSKSIYKTKHKSGNKRNKCEIKRGIGYGNLYHRQHYNSAGSH